MAIVYKTPAEVQKMHAANQVVRAVLDEIEAMVRPGVTTGALGDRALELVREHKVSPAFLGYGDPPFPSVICISINEEIVHGIPGSREMKEGDILSLDFGVDCNGFHGDSAVTVPIGKVSDEAAQLIDTTRDALHEAVAVMVPGKRLSDIGHAVQVRAEREGYSVVRQFVGHGIGREMHEPPQVPNYGRPGRGPRLQSGMVFAIEPMVNVGTERVEILDDEWTAVTADGELSAHFEHTVAVTEHGPEVLTRIEGSH